MRIVGGEFRGKKLLVPEDNRIRPTADRTREALFNILAHDGDMRGAAGALPRNARVLDIFAGTGALGLEALSRGAAHVTFLENHPDSLKIIQGNLQALGLVRRADILRRDAVNPGKPGAPYDLILMDPPYAQGMVRPCLDALLANGWLAPTAIIVIELSKKEELALPQNLAVIKDRTYGAARLVFVRNEPDQYGGISQTAPE